MGCKPASVGLTADEDFRRLRGNSSLTNSTSTVNASAVADASALADDSAPPRLTPTSMPPSACVWNVPVLYEELDVLSNRFSPVNGPNVSVTDMHPTLLVYPLHVQATGGTLNLQLTLNTVRKLSAWHGCMFSSQ